MIIVQLIIALATVLMAIATWRLASETKKLAEITKKAIDLSQQQNTETIEAIKNIQGTMAGLGKF